ncbi:Predicted ATP-binding protein involved in virulence [Chryseobacterium nakagawai]|uniref:ATP-binding protein n=1 Tax=Chryseobacterium nakagawai TaxID=1241982 RepID=A0AAD0YH10_CHRNA|nr:AAA family ATPase [Chryseobacterium nakagawai]AZA89842.1 ATP-binding protein [Chryseobacterium nakagawai]VEH21247.1 Predicted ATP-binding protein involved in virulence [Chryseobacterium nakagawai]
MRLKYLHIIGEYKNLKDFKLDFDGSSFIDVFVGKNGTGKSNLFEAIIEIFRHLFVSDYEINFDYKIVYELNKEDINISWEAGKLLRNGNELKSIPKNNLPDNIIIYYSGHNDKVSDLVTQYEQEFKKKVKGANVDDIREFIGIGKEYKSLLLAILLLQNDHNNAKKYIKQKLGISQVSHEVKIVLKRPDYAIDNEGFDVDPFDNSTAFWKAEGVVGEFLKKIDTVKKGAQLPETRDRQEGYFRNTKNQDEYLLYYDIADMQSKFLENSSLDLFRSFDNLKTIEMLKELSIVVTLENGTVANINNFSDGQFQTVYIYSIVELFKDKNCLTLLDEPDAFLHPEWQFDFLKQVLEINEKKLERNHVLLSSHSAITLLQSEERKVNFFKITNNKLNIYKVDKAYAISQLSSQLINLQVDKQILSIIHTLGQDKPILFTEGYSDPIILKYAYQILYDTNDIPFEICFGHGCLYLRLLLQNKKFLDEMNGRPIFGLFDFDEAYGEWSSIKMNKDLLENDLKKGLAKQFNDRESYALLLPIPNIPEILPQVMKSDGTTYENYSKLEMEHLFYSDTTKESFHEVEITGGAKIIEISDARKMKFSTEIVPKLTKASFEIFRPMFEFIESKVSS